VLDALAPRLRSWLVPALPTAPDSAWLEVRVRVGRPVQVLARDGERWAGPRGVAAVPGGLGCAEPEDVARTLDLVTRASVYAWEEELAQGFCTLPGGHRVGVSGRALRAGSSVRGQKEVGSLVFRLARAVPGAARPLLAACRGQEGLLVVGPPGSGKTTVLRDLVRWVSAGEPAAGLPPRRVVVVDERSELAGAVRGVPQFDLGPRTDVLDGFPKPVGLRVAVRALGPEVLACDEVGGLRDARAIADAARCGVAVFASAHAAGAEELVRRPALRPLLAVGAFGWVAELGPDRRLRRLVRLRPCEP